MKFWEKVFHANGNQKKAGITILISDKIDFKVKTITRDKEGHYIMIKGLIQVENLTIINIHTPNIGTPWYVRQILIVIKWDTDSNEIIMGDFNSLFLSLSRTSDRKSIS